MYEFGGPAFRGLVCYLEYLQRVYRRRSLARAHLRKPGRRSSDQSVPSADRSMKTYRRSLWPSARHPADRAEPRRRIAMNACLNGIHREHTKAVDEWILRGHC